VVGAVVNLWLLRNLDARPVHLELVSLTFAVVNLARGFHRA
jgi:hypothetical protein